MKPYIKFMIFIIILVMSLSVFAQDDRGRTRISVEIDPVTFAFGGFSGHLRIQPANSQHWLVGAGAYAMDMPKFIVDINKANRDEGWNVRINAGYGLFTEYYFTKVNSGWFLGGQTSIQHYKLENENTEEGSENYTIALMMPYAGYTFQPFDFNLYFKAWAGIGYSSKIAGTGTLQGNTYEISPVTMFSTFHIGYTF